ASVSGSSACSAALRMATRASCRVFFAAGGRRVLVLGGSSGAGVRPWARVWWRRRPWAVSKPRPQPSSSQGKGQAARDGASGTGSGAGAWGSVSARTDVVTAGTGGLPVGRCLHVGLLVVVGAGGGGEGLL